MKFQLNILSFIKIICSIHIIEPVLDVVHAQFVIGLLLFNMVSYDVYRLNTKYVTHTLWSHMNEKTKEYNFKSTWKSNYIR